ncbi:MAG TPA: TlpA disulfide reductase family protein [Pyrinomonadaceae bacterium]|jgi:thiol-disulfide isomerase/thioredoxin|nr:TlpA disulfide reductase family protein [Pyrinomonadaceae bacterium]
MSSAKQTRGRAARRFLTPPRPALTFLACALVALAASSCTYSPDTANANANASAKAGGTPTVNIRSGPAGAAPNAPPAAPKNTTPPKLTDLPLLADSVVNTQVQLLDGKSLKLSDYKGKVVVLDLWATWCPPCRDEIPHLIALSKEFESKGVEVIGLTTEEPSRDTEKVQDFVRRFNINYKIGWAEQPLAVALARGRDSIPQTFIITRDGRLLKHFVGFSPASSPPMIRDAIEMAIKM